MQKRGSILKKRESDIRSTKTCTIKHGTKFLKKPCRIEGCHCCEEVGGSPQTWPKQLVDSVCSAVLVWELALCLVQVRGCRQILVLLRGRKQEWVEVV